MASSALLDALTWGMDHPMDRPIVTNLDPRPDPWARHVSAIPFFYHGQLREKLFDPFNRIYPSVDQTSGGTPSDMILSPEEAKYLS
jgi:hypothetical protein